MTDYIDTHSLHAHISYEKSTDGEFVDLIKNILKYDYQYLITMSDNENFEQVKESINNCNFVVCIITTKYDLSSESRRELSYAKSRHKSIIFIMLNKFKLLKYIGLHLYQCKLIDVYNDVDNFKNLSDVFKKFIKQIESFRHDQKEEVDFERPISIDEENGDDTEHIKKFIEHLKNLAFHHSLHNCFEDWLTKEKQKIKFRVMLIGEESVGKSTLLNGMLKKEIQVTSGSAKTRKIIEIDCEAEGVNKLKTIIFIDTTGRGESCVTSHDEALEKYIKGHEIDAFIIVATPIQPPKENLREFLNLKPEIKKYLVLTNRNNFQMNREINQGEYIRRLSNIYNITNADAIHQIESVYDYDNENEYNQTHIPHLINSLMMYFKKKKINAIKCKMHEKIDNLSLFFTINRKNSLKDINEQIKNLKEKEKAGNEKIEALLNFDVYKQFEDIKNEVKEEIKMKTLIDTDFLNKKIVDKLTQIHDRFDELYKLVNEKRSDYNKEVLQFSYLIEAVNESMNSWDSKWLYNLPTAFAFALSSLEMITLGSTPQGWGIMVGIGSHLLISKYRNKKFKSNIDKAIDDKIESEKEFFIKWKDAILKEHVSFRSICDERYLSLVNVADTIIKETDLIMKNLLKLKEAIDACVY